MKIGGIHKNSFIDFPNNISCVVFFSGCNLHCPYCHNPELALGTQQIENGEKTVVDFLKKRKGFLEGVVFSGGEPTLQEDALISLAQTAKELGYRVKLDTNGTKPQVIEKLIAQQMVDYIAMDIKTELESYNPHFSKKPIASSLLKTIRLLKTGKIPYEFRTTCVKPYVSLQMIEKIAPMLGRIPLYALQQPHQEKVLDVSVFANKNCEFSTQEIESLRQKAFLISDTVILR